MFLREAEMDFNEVKFLLTEIINILKTITHEGKILLITSLSLDDKLPPFIIELGNMIVKYFSKCVTIDNNNTNNKFKIVIQQKQDADYIAVKKYTSLTAEDVLTVKER
jgi:hypothetical protein